MRGTRSRWLALAVSAGVLAVAGPAVADERSPLENPEPTKTVRVQLPGTVQLAELEDQGFDFGHSAKRVPDGIEATTNVTLREELELAARGVKFLEPGEEFKWVDRPARPFKTAKSKNAALPRPPEAKVRVVRADWFTTKGQGFLYVEARLAESEKDIPGIQLQLAYDRGAGTDFGTPLTMTRFNDSGVYMFHRLETRPDVRPDRIKVTSSTGGEAIGTVSDWLEDVTPLTDAPGYKWDFIQEYKHPQQLYSRFEEIAQQYPDIAEIVRLPNKTGGYQRHAQATIGGTGQSAVVVSSAAWGHEGGNDITVEFAAQSGANQPLSVQVDGKAVKVLLGTDAEGQPSSTAAQVADAIEAGSQGLINRAHPYRTNAGTGVVQPTPEPVQLTDFLDQKRDGAPAGDPPRGPYEIRALRIGKHRDGSKPGVLIQASDHAREWVPMTITAETAERLVANYETDAATRDIVDNVDIFLVPANNPDGANYSFWNFASQRKNLTNYCPDSNADPGRRNSWGVDLNRNYRVGSAHDGYSGGSNDCLSGTFQGPEKLSEPEARNAIWTVETYPNIKFFMSVHSNGGQLFWQPGAYIANGRITTPRPPLGHEAYYWQSANRILSHVRAFRQTVVTPENVGGSSDVLYSSAGNVREDLYHNYGIYSFGWEVGGSVWDPERQRWQGGSFQPPWEAGGLISGHDETMEYANGVMEMFRIAADWGRDKTAATSTLVAPAQSDSPVGVRFEVSEPATVYYTTDGSAPSMESTRYNATEFREPGETLWVEQTTTFRWISVDAAGNVEDAQSQTVQIGEEGTIGGEVPATLSLALGAPASFGAFVPGTARDYTASTTADVTSTAGDATLSVADPSGTNTGHLVNGSFSLASALQAAAGDGAFADVGATASPTTLKTYSGPVANDAVELNFKQAIGADEALRTGTYAKTLTFTLSTTQP